MYEIGGLTPDDIAQELRIRVWNVRYSYVPKKSSMKTFVDFVVRNHIKDLYKASKRKKQFLNRALPFDVTIEKNIIDEEEEWRKIKELNNL